jgi:hypothetical protein
MNVTTFLGNINLLSGGIHHHQSYIPKHGCMLHAGGCKLADGAACCDCS